MSTQGRFTSSDDFFKDSQLEDPQSWNKYAYVRNNPLALVDPTGEKAKVTIEVDKDKKTGTITIEASFGVYAASGQSVTAAEVGDQAIQIKEQIEGTYSGSFIKDGITYTVSAQIAVQVVESEAKAVEGGKNGKFDNIVEVGNRDLMSRGGDANGFVLAGADAHRFRGERFDRLQVDSREAGFDNMFAHEFSHLLGSASHRGDVSNANGNPRPFQITQSDFNLRFSAQIGRAVRSAGPNVETRRAPLVPRGWTRWRR